MDMTWLQTFVVAAEEGNFHNTARRLHLAQPTVTLHIQKLENLWGVHLFERTGRSVQLSRAGRRFLVHAKTLLDRYIESLEDMARFHQGYEATLRIFTSPVVATTYLPHWIQSFGKLHPNIEFSIQVVDSEYILPAILMQEADLGFSRLHVAHHQVHCTSLYSDPVRMVAPKGASLVNQGCGDVAAELLARYPLFTHHHPEYWNEFLITLRTAYPNIRTITVNQSHVALEWVAENMGVSFFSTSTLQKALQRQTIELIDTVTFSLPMTYTYLIMPTRPTALAQNFAEFIQNIAAGIYSSR